jgi:hypothetical protein
MSQGRSVPAPGQSGQNEPRIEHLRIPFSMLGREHLQFDIMQVADLAVKYHFSANC